MKGEVVTVVSMLGEVVGRLKEETETSVTLTDPRLFVQQDQGAGFAPGVCMTGQKDPSEITFNKSVVLTVLLTHDDLVKGWTSATTGIIL
jgi:hypothetical protein